MSWATDSDAIQTVMQSITNIGNVYIGERHLRDEARTLSLLKFSLGASVDPVIRAWFITRESIAETRFTPTRTEATERYTLRGYFGVKRALDGVATGESEFQGYLDSVAATFRTRVTIGDSYYKDVAVAAPIEFGRIGEWFCYTADVNLDLRQLYTISLATQSAVPAPGAASTRSDYEDVAASIAYYLEQAAADTDWIIHNERPYGVDIRDRRDLFEIVIPDDPAQARRVAAWRIYRDGNEEARDIGNRVTADPAWRLVGALSWADGEDGDSYSEFQIHIDAVRAIFRGVGNLGNTNNVSQSVSAPLQVTMSPRTIMGVLCHLAECELPVHEVVHA